MRQLKACDLTAISGGERGLVVYHYAEYPGAPGGWGGGGFDTVVLPGVTVWGIAEGRAANALDFSYGGNGSTWGHETGGGSDAAVDTLNNFGLAGNMYLFAAGVAAGVPGVVAVAAGMVFSIAEGWGDFNYQGGEGRYGAQNGLWGSLGMIP